MVPQCMFVNTLDFDQNDERKSIQFNAQLMQRVIAIAQLLDVG